MMVEASSIDPYVHRTCIIRAAAASDLPALYSLIHSVYDSTDMMCEEFYSKYPTVDDLQTEWTASKDGSLFMLASTQSPDYDLLGYLTIKRLTQSKLAHTAYLNMGVNANARGRSLGRQLLEAALGKVRNEKLIEILYLNVREDNLPAIKLYESFQFETVARLERDTKIGDTYYTGLLMRLFI